MSIKLTGVGDLDEVTDGLKNFLALCHEFDLQDPFKTAEKALYDIPKLKPDIAVIDINLPGMEGIKCIRQVKGKNPKTLFM